MNDLILVTVTLAFLSILLSGLLLYISYGYKALTTKYAVLRDKFNTKCSYQLSIEHNKGILQQQYDDLEESHEALEAKYKELESKYKELEKKKAPKITDSEAFTQFFRDATTKGGGVLDISYVNQDNIYYHRS